MKKEILKIVIKVIIYALGLVGAYLGVTSLSSCSTSHGVQYDGKGVIITSDTIHLNHSGYLKSKNFKPYDCD